MLGELWKSRPEISDFPDPRVQCFTSTSDSHDIGEQSGANGYDSEPTLRNKMRLAFFEYLGVEGERLNVTS